MQIYNYDPVTRRYTGSTVADPNPQRPTAPIVPAFATPLAPPQAPAGCVAVFQADAWTVEALPLAPQPEPAAPAPSLAQEAASIRAALASLDARLCAVEAAIAGGAL